MTEVLESELTSAGDPVPKPSRTIRAVRFVGWTSVALGLFILGFVVHQVFVTTWLSQQRQTALTEEAQEHFAAAEITEVEYVPPTLGAPVDAGTTGDAPEGGTVSEGAAGTIDPDAPRVGEPRTLLVEAPPDKHQAFAIIRVPSIDRLREGWTVVEGVSRRDLRSGAGHMPQTALPGQPGNSVISGHRTTYGAPFHEFDELEPGDVIEVETATGVHTYEVRESIIVRPTEVWVTDAREGAWLTLTTCHPKFRSIQRLVVFAELVAGPNAAVISS
jgi:LPXTG-site transpeptidase (sortase) family protein